MSLYLDLKYTLLAKPYLERFRKVSDYVFNMRCPICNDSQKSKTKARGYIYKKNDSMFFCCKNCNAGFTLRNFLKHVKPWLADEYGLEKYKEKNSDRVFSNTPVIKHKEDIKRVEIDLPNIKDLKEDHIAKKYLIERMIPEKYYELFYYAEDFQKFAIKISNKEYKAKYHTEHIEPRIIIPFLDVAGNLIALQGRSLFASKLRYITIKFDENTPKIFGLERWNKLKKTYVVEGPIDSLFLPNALAMAGSNLNISSIVEEKNNVIFIADREPRNKDIISNIDNWIEQGYSICLFPDTLNGKDINDFVMNGMTQENLIKIIDENTFKGLTAKIQLANWKKIL